MEKLEKIHVFNSIQWAILKCTTGTLGVSKQVHHWGLLEANERNALFEFLKFFLKASLPIPKRKEQ